MIHKLHFSIDIKAEKPKIWEALWSKKYYKDWAWEFYAGSYAKSDN